MTNHSFIYVIQVDRSICGLYTSLESAETDFDLTISYIPKTMNIQLLKVQKNLRQAGLLRKAEIVKSEFGTLKL